MTERFDVDFVAVSHEHNHARNLGVADVARGDVAQLFCSHIAAMTGGAGETHRAFLGTLDLPACVGREGTSDPDRTRLARPDSQ
jgi:hypothetical protein